MSDMPKALFASPDVVHSYQDYTASEIDHQGATEYIRADIHDAKVAELEQTLTAACNRDGDCIARHIEGGVCCAWIGRDAAQQEDQQ